MEVELKDIGKRFQKSWIFENLSTSFPQETRCAVLGGNGSGKSTLLQIISGYLSPSAGEVLWKKNGQLISIDALHKHVSMCTPFLSLHDDLTLAENVEFFTHFKPLRQDWDTAALADLMGLSAHKHKTLRQYSSGMRQRVKLALAILANTDLLLLDEPTSHLDHKAIDWFAQLLEQHLQGRSLFVASNSEAAETAFCTSSLIVEQFRTSTK
jgi:ABC-type multidrug transport system ATPase subunit